MLKVNRSQNKIIEPQILPTTKKTNLVFYPEQQSAQKANLFVCFLGKSRAQQFCFEIYQPQVSSITLKKSLISGTIFNGNNKIKLPPNFRISTMASGNGRSRWYHQGFSNGWFRIFIVSKTSQKEIWKYLCRVKRIFIIYT